MELELKLILIKPERKFHAQIKYLIEQNLLKLPWHVLVSKIKMTECWELTQNDQNKKGDKCPQPTNCSPRIFLNWNPHKDRVCECNEKVRYKCSILYLFLQINVCYSYIKSEKNVLHQVEMITIVSQLLLPVQYV